MGSQYDTRIRIVGDASSMASAGAQAESSINRVVTSADRLTAKLSGGAAGINASFASVESSARTLTQRLEKVGDGAAGLRANAAAAGETQGKMNLLATAVQGYIGLKLAQTAYAGATALFGASAAAERMRISLSAATGGDVRAEVGYMRTLTERLGLEMTSTAVSYAQFAAAARGTALQGQGARDVFESVAMATSVMGLTADQSRGVMLALQQMMSKGTVQAEELRGQLGERMPGAFNIAARAMGVTTQELGKMLEQGQVISADFLPKFAAQLKQELGGSAEEAATRLDASVNRFTNAWDRLKQMIGDAGVAKGGSYVLRSFSQDMTAVSDAMDVAKARGSGFFGQINSGLGMIIGRSIGLDHLSSGFQTFDQRLAAAQKRVEEARAALEKNPSNFYTRNEMGQANEELLRVNTLARMMGRVPTGSTSDFRKSELMTQDQADQGPYPNAKSVADVAKYAKIDLDLKRDWQQQALELSQSYAQAISRSTDPAEQARLQTELGQRLAAGQKDLDNQLKKRALDSGKSGVESALGTLSMTAERYAMALKPAYEEIDADRKQDLISEQEAIARRTALKQAEIDKEIATAKAKIVVLRGKADSEREIAKEEEVIVTGAMKKAALQRQAEIETAAAVADATRKMLEAYAERRDAMRDYIAQTARDNRSRAIELLPDDAQRTVARAQAEIADVRRAAAEQMQAMQKQLQNVTNRQAYEQGLMQMADAEQATADRIVLINREMVQRLKPEWEQMLEAWTDKQRQMREIGNEFMRGWLTQGESIWTQWFKTGKLNISSLKDLALDSLAQSTYRQYLAKPMASLGEKVAGWLGFTPQTGADAAAASSTTALQLANQSLAVAAGAATVALQALASSAMMLTSSLAVQGASGMASGVADGLGGAMGGFDWGSLFQNAKGGAYVGGQRLSFLSKGDLLNQPTVFKTRTGVAIGGEAGTEAIMPLRRTSSGDLGVIAQSSAQRGATKVEINNYGADVAQETTTGADGTEFVRLTVRAAKQGIIDDLAAGGKARGAVGSAFGLRPALARRG